MTSFDPNNHEHDGDENCLNDDGSVHVFEEAADPNWEWSPWDGLGVLAHTLGGVMNMVGQGFTLLAREFYAAGQFSRKQREEMRAKFEAAQRRKLIIDDIRSLERGEVDDG